MCVVPSRQLRLLSRVKREAGLHSSWLSLTLLPPDGAVLHSMAAHTGVHAAVYELEAVTASALVLLFTPFEHKRLLSLE